MPRYVIDRLAEASTSATGAACAAAKILILGIAYKKNVDDMRESPAFKLIELLEERGAETAFYDPHVPVIPRRASIRRSRAGAPCKLGRGGSSQL